MQIDENKIEELINVVSSQSEYDFRLYSKKSLYRRIEKSLKEFKTTLSEMIDRLKRDKVFMETFVKYITVNTTSFYRDIETWKLYEKYLNTYFKDKKEINIWHIGCSTGLEVYSNLILLHSCGILSKSNIYATDINSDVLKTAQAGVYKYIHIPDFKSNYNKAISEMSSNLDMENYLNIYEEKHTVAVKSFLLNKAIYKKHNILSKTNPFDIKFDIIFSRNIIMYFNHDIQAKLYSFLYDNLNTEGCCIIGRYEAIISSISEKFEKKEVIYKKL